MRKLMVITALLAIGVALPAVAPVEAPPPAPKPFVSWPAPSV